MLKKITVVAVALLMVIAMQSCFDKNSGYVPGDMVELKTDFDTVAYVIGSGLGQQLHSDSLTMNLKAMNYGMRTGMDGGELLFDQQAIQKIMQAFTMKVQEKKQTQQGAQTPPGHEAPPQMAGGDNKEESEKFLAENKKKPGIKTLDNGVQYKVLKSGNGKSPLATDVVKVHYHGTMINGVVFDSSVDRGEPSTFPLNQVIAGWGETIPHMKVGDKWKLFIPSDKAYGAEGRPGIPPNTALIFEVELLEVVVR